MSKRLTPPFHADHVGSLLRPARLIEACAQARTGILDQATLQAIEDDCIVQAVKMQESIGLTQVSNCVTGKSVKTMRWDPT
jgi:5-methyltetrahydropteroyltriglutamate--homocysteine methyltransferase